MDIEKVIIKKIGALLTLYCPSNDICKNKRFKSLIKFLYLTTYKEVKYSLTYVDIIIKLKAINKFELLRAFEITIYGYFKMVTI